MSWLKFDTTTPEKPEVLQITIELGFEDPDMTVGKLLKVWRWFDAHSLDGNAKSVTLALLDRLVGVTGIGAAMVSVGWLIANDDGLTLPNFENHNGKTAKDRALTAKRVGSYRSNALCNAETVTDALPREEKRREEKIEIPNGISKAQAPKQKASKRCPADFVVTREMVDWASESGITVDLNAETEKFRDHEYKAAKTDWLACWRTWMRNAQQYARGSPAIGKQQALEDHNDAIAAQFIKDLENGKRTVGGY
jgi:hypothetical protein